MLKMFKLVEMLSSSEISQPAEMLSMCRLAPRAGFMFSLSDVESVCNASDAKICPKCLK